jgi:uncharacterized protein (TIGR03435 family)
MLHFSGIGVIPELWTAAGVNRAMKLFLVGVGMAIAMPLTVQAQTSAQAAFEVASVKTAPPMNSGGFRMGIGGGPGSPTPGTITADHMPLRNLIMQAYGVKTFQIEGPAWLNDTYFDVVAKVPEGATKEQVPGMWRALLEERFKLTLHRETRELPVYALQVGKGGPKLDEAAPEPPAEQASDSHGFTVSAAAPAGARGGNSMTFTRAGAPGKAQMSGTRLRMASFADMLGRNLDRPVVDETGLTGQYKIKLEWQRDEARPAAGDTEVSDLPDIFGAVQQQLGLKLQAKKANVEILVIDHIEKSATEN